MNTPTLSELTKSAHATPLATRTPTDGLPTPSTQRWPSGALFRPPVFLADGSVSVAPGDIPPEVIAYARRQAALRSITR